MDKPLTPPFSLNTSVEFWDQLAPHHAALENNFFDLRSVRTLLKELAPPVLIVGAGQGLIVNELIQRGINCDGVDLSPEMIRFAKERRGLTLVHADALAMPFHDQSYGTIIYATGVIDFMANEQAVGLILQEGRRVVQQSGKIFVAFYRLSDALERFLMLVDLLKDGVLDQKASLETYLLGPAQMVRWLQHRTNTKTWRVAALFLRLAVGTTIQEKLNTRQMQKLFRNREAAMRLIECAPHQQPYRNKAKIEALFARLAIPINEFQTLRSCFIVKI